MVKSTALLEFLSKKQAHTTNALSQAATLKRSQTSLKKAAPCIEQGLFNAPFKTDDLIIDILGMRPGG
jgi:hypothetical protein